MCSILLFSCQEQVVELDIPGHTPFLVVNGILDTDTLMFLHVSNSVGSFQQGEINSISDANVLLYENNILIGEMKVDNNNQDSINVFEDGPFWWGANQSKPIYYYSYNDFPQPGSTYSIEVTHPNFETVYAQTTVPNEIQLAELEIVDNSDQSEDYSSTLNLSFFDDPNTNNYYRISLYRNTQYEDQESGDMIRKEYPLDLYSNDPSFSQGIPWDGYSFSGRRVFLVMIYLMGHKKKFHLILNLK